MAINRLLQPHPLSPLGHSNNPFPALRTCDVRPSARPEKEATAFSASFVSMQLLSLISVGCSPFQYGENFDLFMGGRGAGFFFSKKNVVAAKGQKKRKKKDSRIRLLLDARLKLTRSTHINQCCECWLQLLTV